METMRKSFNITGDCKPNLHYMVNIDSRLVQIKKMVDSGSYITINRARQYGKTTTLRALSRFLTKDYLVASLDFQMMSASKFRNENTFSVTFARIRAFLSVCPVTDVFLSYDQPPYVSD